MSSCEAAQLPDLSARSVVSFSGQQAQQPLRGVRLPGHLAWETAEMQALNRGGFEITDILLGDQWELTQFGKMLFV